MDEISPNDLNKLTGQNYCITITMEAHPIISGALENPIKLKNMLDIAKQKLQLADLSNVEIDSYLKKVINLVDDSAYWRDQFSSLLIYISKNEFKAYKLPIQLQEGVTISRNCNILPMFEYLSNNFDFYLLALDEGGSRLFKGNKYSLLEITSEPLKTSKKDMMANLEIEEEQFYHVERPGGRANDKQGVVFHGHGNEKDDRKIRMRQLLKIFEKEVSELLRGKSAYLILAGHDFITSAYREISNYPKILKTTIRLDLAEFDQKSIQKKVSEIIEQEMQIIKDKDKERYCNLVGTGKTTNNIEEILKTASEGKINELFIEKGYQVFGRLDEKNDSKQVTITENENDENLTNLAALITTKNSGKVKIFSEKEMPDKGICAILRY